MAAAAPTSTTPPIETLEGSDCLWDQQSFQGLKNIQLIVGYPYVQDVRLSVSCVLFKHLRSVVCLCRSSGVGGSEASPGRTYVDNSVNRRLGRVGMALGSMPVSRDSGTSSMASPKKVFSPSTISHFTSLL